MSLGPVHSEERKRMQYLKQTHNYMINGGKWKDVKEVSFWLFTGTGKMMISADFNKLCIYKVMPRAMTKDVMQRDTVKTTINKSKCHFKTTHREAVKSREKWKTEQTENKK